METPNHDSQALPAETRLEEFTIERVLGSGGFGITYLARDTSLGRKVVIKENLPVDLAWRDPESRTVRPRHNSQGGWDDYAWALGNFTREADTLAALDHQGIVRVLRKFEANGTAYFAMPYVEGWAFDREIELRRQRNEPFTQSEIEGFINHLLDALDYLHAREILHRDIKPANILLAQSGMPVLIDFGAARQRLGDRSMTVLESPGYTPFEQLQTKGNVGSWSDLYALGATVCKAITFEAPPKVTDRTFSDPMVPLASRKDLRERYSATLLASIDRAISVRPEDRWENASQWRQGLTHGMEILTVPPPGDTLSHGADRASPVVKSTTGTPASMVGKQGRALGLGFGIAVAAALAVASLIWVSQRSGAPGDVDVHARILQERREIAEAETRAKEAQAAMELAAQQKQEVEGRAREAELQRLAPESTAAAEKLAAESRQAAAHTASQQAVAEAERRLREAEARTKQAQQEKLAAEEAAKAAKREPAPTPPSPSPKPAVGGDLDKARKELAAIEATIFNQRLRWKRAIDEINMLTDHKRVPVVQGSEKYHRCLAASKIIEEVERGSADLKAQKAKIEATVKSLEAAGGP